MLGWSMLFDAGFTVVVTYMGERFRGYMDDSPWLIPGQCLGGHYREGAIPRGLK